jgi:hypothetical protein
LVTNFYLIIIPFLELVNRKKGLARRNVTGVCRHFHTF